MVIMVFKIGNYGMYYVRATGLNRFTGDGTSRWLKIRSLDKIKDGYSIGVRINGRNKYVDVSTEHGNSLEFAMGWPGLMPISLERMLRGVKEHVK